MKLQNCAKCGKLYKPIIRGKYCPACEKKEDEVFQRVKDYLYDNPGAGIDEISEECDATHKQIMQYLREGRLETIGDNMIIQCEKCGEFIRTGRYCSKCMRVISLNLKSAAKKIGSSYRDDKGIGMHTKK